MTNKTESLHEAFLSAFNDYPNQDTEGWVPDRGSFKTGFMLGWKHQADKYEAKIEKLESENQNIKQQVKEANEVISKMELEHDCPPPTDSAGCYDCQNTGLQMWDERTRIANEYNEKYGVNND